MFAVWIMSYLGAFYVGITAALAIVLHMSNMWEREMRKHVAPTVEAPEPAPQPSAAHMISLAD